MTHQTPCQEIQRGFRGILVSREANIDPAHASLHDVMRKIGNVWNDYELSEAVGRLKRLKLLEPTSRSL
jgi:hypothetical protein